MDIHKRQSLLQQANRGKMINALKLADYLLPARLGNIQILKKIEKRLQPSHKYRLQILLPIELQLGNLIVQLVPIKYQWAFFSIERLALNEHLGFLPVHLVLKLVPARVDVLHHFVFHWKFLKEVVHTALVWLLGKAFSPDVIYYLL